MKALLDTQIFIWWDSEPAKLSPTVLEICENPANTLLLSVGSVWEIEIKRQLGKLTLRDPLDRIIAEQRVTNNVALLDVQLMHVLRLASLPPIHKDPFDRILVAQALTENAVLLSADATVAAYPAPVIW